MKLLAVLSSLVFAVAPLAAQEAGVPVSDSIAAVAPAPAEAAEHAAQRAGDAAAADEDYITPHITDSHHLELPYWKPPFHYEVSLPQWEPIPIGGREPMLDQRGEAIVRNLRIVGQSPPEHPLEPVLVDFDLTR